MNSHWRDSVPAVDVLLLGIGTHGISDPRVELQESNTDIHFQRSSNSSCYSSVVQCYKVKASSVAFHGGESVSQRWRYTASGDFERPFRERNLGFVKQRLYSSLQQRSLSFEDQIYHYLNEWFLLPLKSRAAGPHRHQRGPMRTTGRYFDSTQLGFLRSSEAESSPIRTAYNGISEQSHERIHNVGAINHYNWFSPC